MKPLSISDALKLYALLSPYLPDPQKVDTGTEFIGKIVQNIVSAEKYQVYLDAIALMMDINIDDILDNLSVSEAISMFSEGLQVNKILDLQVFCKKVGFYG